MVKISILKLFGASKDAKKKILTTVGPKFKKKKVSTQTLKSNNLLLVHIENIIDAFLSAYLGFYVNYSTMNTYSVTIFKRRKVLNANKSILH